MKVRTSSRPRTLLAATVPVRPKPVKPGTENWESDGKYNNALLDWLNLKLGDWHDHLKELERLHPPSAALRHQVDKGRKHARLQVANYEHLIVLQLKHLRNIERIKELQADARRHAQRMQQNLSDP